AGELLDPVAAVLQLAVLDRRDRRGRRDHTLQATWSGTGVLDGHLPSLAHRPSSARVCRRSSILRTCQAQLVGGTVPPRRSGRPKPPGEDETITRRARLFG